MYHCLYYGVRSPTEYDVVVVDEVQDLNDANHAFLRRCVAPESRHTVVCAVGDPAQAIYQFRGANPRSLCKFRDVFAAESLSLTCCFRCPRRVVAVAAYLNRDISAAPGAELGTVRVHTAARHWVADLLRLAECAPPGEVTLFTTRCNATVIDILLYLHTLSPGCGLSIRWAAPTVASQLREVLEWPGHFTLQSLHDTAADPTTGDHAPVDRAVLRLLATAIQTEGPDSDAATSPFLAHALRALAPLPAPPPTWCLRPSTALRARSTTTLWSTARRWHTTPGGCASAPPIQSARGRRHGRGSGTQHAVHCHYTSSVP